MKKNLLSILLLFSITFTFSQTTIGLQDFDGGLPTLNYTNSAGTTIIGSGLFPNTPNYVSATTGFGINNTTGTIEFSPVDASTYSNIDFSVRLASFAGTSGNGADGSDYVIISISTDGGTTYSDELEINGNNNAKWGFSGTNAGTGIASINYDGNNTTTVFNPATGGYSIADGYSYLSITNLPSSSNLRIKIEMSNNSNNETWVIDDVLIEGDAPTGPTIVLNPTALTGLDYSLGAGPSTEQTFTAEGFLLTSNLLLTAPTNYEISTTSGSGFGATVSLVPTTGTVASTTIYTRLAAGLTVNTYTGDITATSALATNKTVALSGDVLAPLADVVITELSYNSSGGDDEWIEICNLSGIAQDLNSYIVDNGSVLFTFPAATSIAAGTCITVSLGSNGDGSYNNDCPFMSDYGVSASINNTNNLNNTSETIVLYAANGTSIVDSVVFNSTDGANGNGSTLHVIDATLDNSNTGSNWQEVATGGSPGANTLISPCSIPELQLVDTSNTDQACGYSIAFGSQATGFNTDITFDIDNDGTLDLDIASLVLSGTDATSFSIVTPATPFTVTAGSTQTVTVRFTPTTIGVKNATLTINNNDADEGTCTILLQGTGTTPEQEINVEGNLGAFPDIANGDITPSSLDNTLFAAQNIGNSQTKSYRIQNIGTANLDIANIAVGGINPGDFTISLNPAPFTVTPNQNPPGLFEITFSPMASGTRTATITITNNDLDENPFTFTVQGNGLCNPGSITIVPTSGPENTIVTITGTNLTTATATVSGLAATVNNLSATTMEVTIPTGATSGIIEITDDLGCPASTPFTLIDNSGSCGSTTGLMMTEVYDNSSGSLGYVEIFNGTGATVDLTLYEINRFGTLTSTTSSHTYTFPATGTGSTIADGQVLVGKISTDTGSAHDFIFGGSTAGFNDNDRLELTLVATGVVVDDFHDTLVGATGYVYRRNTDVVSPNTAFDASEWTTATSGDTSNLGTFVILTNTPTITLQPQDINNCNDAIVFTTAATPGNSGTLTYQWYYNDTVSNGWTSVISSSFAPGTVTGETSTTLSIAGADLQDYQFYCEVTEDASCSTATNAARINVGTTTWTLGAWDNGTPDLNTKVIINDSYDTATFGSFSACSLTINSNPSGTEFRLTVNNNTYVEIENDVVVDGELYIETQGNFVQNNDAATFTLNTDGLSLVNKRTTPLNSIYEYTYWSSPVENTTIGQGLAFANPSRRYVFNAVNFLDNLTEINNTNTFTPGPDGIDDDGNDWALIPGSTVMTPGVGYISMHSPIGFSVGSQYTYTFEGAFNTGIITSPIAYNGANGDEDWNLIGNPYPSAIDANAFLTNNAASIQGVAYLWSHNTPANANASGNQGANFNSSDYAIITTGSGNTAGGDGIIPTSYIPSGQAFFVQGVANSSVTFNNSLRTADATSNDQFFRSSNTLSNRLWVNLTSDTGVFHQILVAYVNGATDGKDSKAYDANKTLYNNNAAEIFTSVPGDSDKLAIQGKAPESLTIDEVIPVGFNTNITTATVYTFSIAQLEGDFLSNNTVYLKDNLLSSLHNLSNSDYNFTSETGTFNDRFEIVFKDSSLSIDEETSVTQNISIIENKNNDITFSLTSQNLTIKSIKIYDVLGRLLYDLKGNSNTETYNLSNLSQASYIAHIQLSDGQLISKKAIKQ
ncbi:choice-of-anchor D domain-containing protein [Olleya sp. UBA1516]|uniref:choice-of-anchor D domain-containing protein n=1 Tax=Olleya sp. UBA1516 TaxID=1947013 RepID=UPI0025E05A73|nr:choice-of-anchor D domain-containing protein [Olleya sp. UBA1516]|tara:strand:- start:19489 stop:24483 length:4995 start_codon:yes stop_codon:yes gene_type:complete